MATRKSKPQHRVSYHNEHPSPFRRLPFTGEGFGNDGVWALPAAGGYMDGCSAGEVAADAFLKFLSKDKKDCNGLQDFMFAMADRLALVRPAEKDALRGQIVGFSTRSENTRGRAPSNAGASSPSAKRKSARA